MVAARRRFLDKQTLVRAQHPLVYPVQIAPPNQALAVSPNRRPGVLRALRTQICTRQRVPRPRYRLPMVTVTVFRMAEKCTIARKAAYMRLGRVNRSVTPNKSHRINHISPISGLWRGRLFRSHRALRQLLISFCRVTTPCHIDIPIVTATLTNIITRLGRHKNHFNRAMPQALQAGQLQVPRHPTEGNQRCRQPTEVVLRLVLVTEKAGPVGLVDHLDQGNTGLVALANLIHWRP